MRKNKLCGEGNGGFEYFPRFGIFAKCLQLFESVWKFFQVFLKVSGPVRTCSDTFGCIRMPSEALGRFRKILDVFSVFYVLVDHIGCFQGFGCVRTCLDTFGHIRMHSNALGRFRICLKCSIVSCFFNHVGGLLAFGGNYFWGKLLGNIMSATSNLSCSSLCKLVQPCGHSVMLQAETPRVQPRPPPLATIMPKPWLKEKSPRSRRK